MAPDDRDRNFEKALARHLRSSASSDGGANALAGVPAERKVELCPDPEILAAYHDGALSSEERNLWKQHVVGCEHCQLVLAHLETPLDIPESLETNENVAVLKQPVSPPRNTSPAHIARPSAPHNLRWLWLVPVGAIAATLIVWVSLNEPKPLQVTPPSSVEVAENRQPQSVAPLAKSTSVIPNADRENGRKEKDLPDAPSDAGAASASRDLASKSPQNQIQLTQQSPFQAAAKPPHGPFLSQQKQEQQQTMHAAPGAAGALLGKKLDAQVSSSAGDRLEEVQRLKAAPPPAPPPPASEPSFLADGSIPQPAAGKPVSVGGAAPAAPPPAPAPASSVAVPKAESANADAISAVTESVEVSAAPQSAVNGRAMMRAAALQNPHVFWAPGEKQAWRIGPAGSLEHSKDKGVTWTPQISGVYTDLLAGSAPSAKVSWIVGASGTILRTTDGGTHWIKLESPITNNLISVRATDAMHAWIWFVPDPQTGVIKTYQTADGGVTWSPVSNQ
ncbi:MAG TPA: hypothetical protein VKH63_07205 [Candidatus Acidoferrum sp.]|nr:hypothetical protein [Candidatus Acidoferrum sp.]